MKSHWDVIVVGSGATGAVAARRLAEAGLDVLVCEAGPAVDPTDLARLVGQPAPAPVARTQTTQRRLPGFSDRVAPFFVDDDEQPYLSTGDTDFAWFRSRNVGGRTLTWGGVTIRLSDLDLAAGSIDGASPDWPFNEADLSPHYEAIEQLVGVQGNRDGIPHVPDGEFLEPTIFTSAEKAFIEAMEARWPERRVVHGRGVAAGPHRVDASGQPWPAAALPVLLRVTSDSQARVTVSANTVITSLLLDTRSGDVTGAMAVDRLTHEPRELRADTIVLSASTIESTRILLNSRNVHHPEGVGNSSDWLGRNLMDHPAATLTGSVPGVDPHVEDGPPGGPRGFYVPRFRNLPGDSPAEFVRGYQMWGHAGRSAHEATGTARFMLAVCGEMLPDPDNRVSLHEGAVDRWGVPIPIIRFGYGANEKSMMADAIEQAQEMCTAAGFSIEKIDEHYSTIGSYVHEVGTARMGSQPGTSVLDPWNRVWDAPNVLVIDGACWPTSANQNPTLTMMAIADRACTGLLKGAS